MFIITLGEVIGIAFISLIIGLPVWAVIVRKQKHCPHTSVHVDYAKNAVCKRCGKNLGHVNNWLKRR